MLEYDNRMKMILDSILENINAIKYNMECDGETHYSYMLEKLEKAQWDINVLIKMSKDKETTGC